VKRRQPKRTDAPVLYVKIRNGAGHVCTYPLRYLDPNERADYLRRATSPL
jgi:hypothetical protein